MLTIDRQRSFFVTSPNTSGTLSWGGCHTLWDASGVVFASGMGGSGAGVDGGLIAASVLMDVFMSDTTDNTTDAVSAAFRRAHTAVRDVHVEARHLARLGDHEPFLRGTLASVASGRLRITTCACAAVLRLEEGRVCLTGVGDVVAYKAVAGELRLLGAPQVLWDSPLGVLPLAALGIAGECPATWSHDEPAAAGDTFVLTRAHLQAPLAVVAGYFVAPFAAPFPAIESDDPRALRGLCERLVAHEGELARETSLAIVTLADAL